MNRSDKKVLIDIPNRTESNIWSAIPSQKGFTLVELLIVMAMLAGVLAAVFSLYNLQQKTTTIEVDVADVQQNIRIGIDSIVKDLRMAGFMIAGPLNPINAVANGTGMNGTDLITLNSPSSVLIHARVDVTLITNLASTTPVVFTVGSAGEVDMFSNGDVVRVLDSSESAQPANMTFTVTATDRAVPSITMLPSGNATDILFSRGFMISKTGNSTPDTFPNTIEYCLGPSVGCAPTITTCSTGQCLMRVQNGTPTDNDVMAENIQNFQLKYILDGSTAEADTVATLANVRAVRITMTAKNYNTEALSGRAKQKEITTVVKIRNR